MSYVIYSPTVEKYMFVEIERGSNGAEYEFQWIDDPIEATELTDDSIEKLLDACDLALGGPRVRVDQHWYMFVANSLRDEQESKRIASVHELVLVPRVQLRVLFLDPAGLPIVKFGVDFTRAESLL